MNRMIFGVLVSAVLKTIAGKHNFATVEPTLGSNILNSNFVKL